MIRIRIEVVDRNLRYYLHDEDLQLNMVSIGDSNSILIDKENDRYFDIDFSKKISQYENLQENRWWIYKGRQLSDDEVKSVRLQLISQDWD